MFNTFSYVLHHERVQASGNGAAFSSLTVLMCRHSVAQVISVAIAAVVQLYLYLNYLPFYSAAANRAYCSFVTMFAWGAACLAFAQFVPVAHVSDAPLRRFANWLL